MGKFVIKAAKTGPMFNLKAGNGEIIATSETYSSKDACLNGIESVKKNVLVAKIEDQTEKNYIELSNPKFEVYKDKKGEFRFRLKAANGKILCAGEGYTSKDGCMKGIKSVCSNAPKANIVEE